MAMRESIGTEIIMRQIGAVYGTNHLCRWVIHEKDILYDHLLSQKAVTEDVFPIYVPFQIRLHYDFTMIYVFNESDRPMYVHRCISRLPLASFNSLVWQF